MKKRNPSTKTSRRNIVTPAAKPATIEPTYPAAVLALDDLPDPYESPEDPTAFYDDADYGDIYSLLEQLRPLVFENLAFLHPLRKAFLRAYQLDREDQPNLEVVRKIIAAFQSLPDDQRRQILNGWDVFAEDINCDREFVKRRAADFCIKMGMMFCAAENPLCEIGGELVNYYTESCRPVSLIVAVGSRKMQVVDSLRRLADAFERNWEQMVGADQYRLHKLGGHPNLKNPTTEPSPPATYWWADPRFELRTLDAELMGAPARHVEIQEAATGITLGTLAVVIVCDGRTYEEAEQIAGQIIENPATLDKFKKERGIIDRRDFNPWTQAADRSSHE